MKYLKLILVIIIILAVAYCGYNVYTYFKQWEANRFSEMNMLRSNQDMFLKKVTELSTTVTKVVNDTKKTTVEVKPDHTYEALKDEVLELKKDEDANKEEIEILRKELSEQRKAFLASENTMLIKTDDGEKILLYRDENDNWQPASEGIDKIIEHKDLSKDVPILVEEEIKDEVTNWDLKFGGFYSFDKTYGIILSKGIFEWKPYSLNASFLISDFEDFKFAVGGDIGYMVRDNLELGIGYNSNEEVYMKIEYTF